MKRFFINLLLLLFSLMLAIIFSEVVARLYLSYQDWALYKKRADNILTQVPKQELFTHSEKGTFQNRSNAKVHWWGFDISTDSNGCRLGIATPESSEVILFIGDSMVFGLGLPDSLTIPSLLQTELSRYQPVKVVNAGVIGYDFHQYMMQMEKLVPILNPSVVIIGLCYNDLFPNEDPYGTLMRDRGFAAKDTSGAKLTAVNVERTTFSRVKALFRRLSLYKVFKQADLSLRLMDNKPTVHSEPEVIASGRNAPILIDEFLETTVQLGVSCRFVYFPMPSELGDESPLVYVRLLKERGEPILDLGLSRRLDEESYFFRTKEKYLERDIHFNLDGSRIVANEIADWIREGQVVQSN